MLFKTFKANLSEYEQNYIDSDTMGRRTMLKDGTWSRHQIDSVGGQGPIDISRDGHLANVHGILHYVIGNLLIRINGQDIVAEEETWCCVINLEANVCDGSIRCGHSSEEDDAPSVFKCNRPGTGGRCPYGSDNTLCEFREASP